MTVVANTIIFNLRDSADYYNPFRDIGDGQHYLFAARHFGWANTAAPDIADESVAVLDYDIFDEMIFGKLITPDDVTFMIDRHDWTSGTVYDQYDDYDPTLNSKTYYVVSQENGYHVFKCLDNYNGSPSTSQPLLSETEPGDERYRTADNYIWKYMYSINSARYSKFTTANHIPVVENTSVKNFAVNGAIDTIKLISSGNNYYSVANGYFTGIAVGNSLTYAIHADSSSGNNGFYQGSSIYIDSGVGAGQVRKIAQYLNTGNQHRVVLESEFTTTPTTGSHYKISPAVNITGDGTGASAISIVNGNHEIDRFELITPGSNYTYADITITGNTGSSQANTATARAIIPPRGGHGSNVYSEMLANKIGISITFANSESNTISATNDYTRVGILRNPRLSNVVLSTANVIGSFVVGEPVFQYNTDSEITETRITQVQNYTYNIGQFINLNLSSNAYFIKDDVIFQPSSGANATVLAMSGNTATARLDYGTFVGGVGVIKAGNSSVNTTLNSVSQGFTNTIFGRSSSNTEYLTTNSNLVEVALNGIDLYNFTPANTTIKSFSSNNSHISLSNFTLVNTDVITVKQFIETATIQNTRKNVSAVVTASNSTTVSVTDATGMFVTGSKITGSRSAASANVISISGQNQVFDQTFRIIGQKTLGDFQLDDYCEQVVDGAVIASGYIHSIESQGGGNFLYRITRCKGSFVASGVDDKYIQSQNQTIKVRIGSLITPDLIKYTGDVMYLENINAVTRANSQSETVKLAIKFY